MYVPEFSNVSRLVALYLRFLKRMLEGKKCGNRCRWQWGWKTGSTRN